ncbi:MAG: hypothetical protein GX250_04945 [Clostridiales bacterium]|nr:hypothetical protein [Clostridiales bacterium]
MNLTNNVSETNASEGESKLWLTVSLSNQKYAVNCDYVDSIFQLQQEITGLPSASGEIVGVINLRGMMLTLIDLRRLLGMETLEQELLEFESMLRRYQQAHMDWVRELKSCLEDKREFQLPTDPHACAFGKWYDSYKPESQIVALTLAKIDEPHKKLHESALKCFALKDKGEEVMKKLVNEEIQALADQVVGLIEMTIVNYRESYRKVCIAISDGSSRLGIIADSVHAVGKIEKEYPLDKINRSRHVYSLGDMSDGSRALLIDEKQLFTLLD